jgi:hypothetical protein
MPIVESANPMTAPPQRRTPRASQSAASLKKQQIAEDEARQQKYNRRFGALNEIASTGQLILMALKQHADAGALERFVPPLNKEIVKYSMEAEGKLGESIDRLSEVSPLAGIFGAAVPLVIQLAVNHNVKGFKAEAFARVGVVSPRTLEADTRAYIARMEVQAIENERAAVEMARMARESYEAELKAEQAAREG